jgi:hypothetical protein
MLLDISTLITSTGVGAAGNAIVGVGVESSPSLGIYDALYTLAGIADGASQVVGNSPVTLSNLGTPLVYGSNVIVTGTNAVGTLRVTGYTVPNGDVG